MCSHLGTRTRCRSKVIHGGKKTQMRVKLNLCETELFVRHPNVHRSMLKCTQRFWYWRFSPPMAAPAEVLSTLPWRVPQSSGVRFVVLRELPRLGETAEIGMVSWCTRLSAHKRSFGCHLCQALNYVTLTIIPLNTEKRATESQLNPLPHLSGGETLLYSCFLPTPPGVLFINPKF